MIYAFYFKDVYLKIIKLTKDGCRLKIVLASFCVKLTQARENLS